MSARHFALSGALADRVVSLAHILGRPVRNTAVRESGRVSDIIVRWDAGNEHPPVTGVFVKVRNALAVVPQGDVALSQTGFACDPMREWHGSRSGGTMT